MTHEERLAAVTSEEHALAEELYDEMDDRVLDADDLNLFSVAFSLWIGLTHLLLQGGFPIKELQAAVASRAAVEEAQA